MANFKCLWMMFSVKGNFEEPQHNQITSDQFDCRLRNASSPETGICSHSLALAPPFNCLCSSCSSPHWTPQTRWWLSFCLYVQTKVRHIAHSKVKKAVPIGTTVQNTSVREKEWMRVKRNNSGQSEVEEKYGLARQGEESERERKIERTCVRTSACVSTWRCFRIIPKRERKRKKKKNHAVRQGGGGGVGLGREERS